VATRKARSRSEVSIRTDRREKDCKHVNWSEVAQKRQTLVLPVLNLWVLLEL
jgi:hypothetical protein